MTIGIVTGRNGAGLAALLRRLYASGGKEVRVVVLDTNGVQNLREPDDIQARTYFDLLVIDTDGWPLPGAVDGRMVMVSADEKELCRKLCGVAGVRTVVSYGLNGKACITASSVDEDRLLICLQRAFPDITGSVVERREFAVRREGLGSGMMMAAVAAALCGGLSPEMIAAFFTGGEKGITRKACE